MSRPVWTASSPKIRLKWAWRRPVDLSTIANQSTYSLDNDASARHTHHGQEQRQVQDAVQTVLAKMNCPHGTVEACTAESVGMHELELIRDYGRAQEWAALVIGGEEIIPAGRAAWLDFVWLSHKKDQQRRVFEFIRGRSQFL